jgi:non-ribosomal peptide synthase protein (TIGR01720 family)
MHLGVYLNNNTIEYCGRDDNQLKINGHRIEKGEIEKCLQDYDGVREAVVEIVDVNMSKQIKAFFVGDEFVKDSVLREWLSQYLSYYMIPNKIIRVDKVPLTSNGKIDHEKLKSYLNESESIKSKIDNHEAYVILKKVLNCNDIYLEDNFYSLGGDSIKAIQISAEMRKYHRELKVKDILMSNNISEMLGKIVNVNENNRISLEVDDEFYPTPIMRWFLNMEFEIRGYYNQFVHTFLKKDIGAEELTNVFRTIIQSNDIFRLSLNQKDNTIQFRKGEIEKLFSIEVVYLDIILSDDINEITKLLRPKVRCEFDLETDIPFRAILFIGNNKEKILFMVAHHLIIDNLSWRILLQQLEDGINSYNQGIKYDITRTSISYRQWASYIHNYNMNISNSEKEYWNELLVKEPTDIHKQNDIEDIYETLGVIFYEIAEEDVKQMELRGRDFYNIKLEDLLISTLIITLRRITEEEEIVFEREHIGRIQNDDDINVTQTIGWFTCIEPCLFKISENDLEKNLISIKEQLQKKSIYSKQNFQYFFDQNSNLQRKKYIRFNYLGEFDDLESNSSLFSEIGFGLESHEKKELTSLMDIDVFIIEKRIKIYVSFSEKRYHYEEVEGFLKKYKQAMSDILDIMIDNDELVLTPSDFTMENISQEDLNELFL